MASTRALLLILLPPVSVLLAVAARSLRRTAARGVRAFWRAHLAWPEGSSFLHVPAQQIKHARKAAPEQRDHELRVAVYSRKDGVAGGREEPPECVFCLSAVEEGDEIRELGCRHLFHRSCLDGWLARPPATCPLCRCRLLASSSPACQAGAPWSEEDGYYSGEEDSNMVLFMAFVHNSSSWFWSWSS